MLVKIAKHALRIGMFVETVDCPYWEFQKRQFLLSDVGDLRCITRSTARSVTTNKAHSPETPQGSCSAPHVDIGARTAHSIAATLSGTMESVSTALIGVQHGQPLNTTRLRGVVGLLDKTASEAPNVFVKLSRLKRADGIIFLHSISVSALMMPLGRS